MIAGVTTPRFEAGAPAARPAWSPMRCGAPRMALSRHGQPRGAVSAPRPRRGFRLDAILAAHRAHPEGAADDVELAIRAGLPVTVTPGDENNLKLTYPPDFARAARILAESDPEDAMDIRLGNGFDVHAFMPGDHVWLCGVKIPMTRRCWAIRMPMSACMR